MADRIQLDGLCIRTHTRTLVDGASLTLEAGQIVGLVGASGCGKTLTARALMGLVQGNPWVAEGSMEVRVGTHSLRPYDGRRRVRAPLRGFGAIRGDQIGYMPQNARAALDPLRRVGAQVLAAARLAGHGGNDPSPWLERADLHPSVARRFPHELSGGMAQRVVIAQGLARGSRFLLADEPTTGLDPTVQQRILTQLCGLRDSGIGVLLITHDLRILPQLADHILVMDRGAIVERAQPAQLGSGKLNSEAGRRLVSATRRVAGQRLG